MATDFKPRGDYGFDKMDVGSFIKVDIPFDDLKAGRRALIAAYAFGRRNNMKFAGRTRSSKNKFDKKGWIEIHRVK